MNKGSSVEKSSEMEICKRIGCVVGGKEVEAKEEVEVTAWPISGHD